MEAAVRTIVIGLKNPISEIRQPKESSTDEDRGFTTSSRRKSAPNIPSEAPIHRVTNSEGQVYEKTSSDEEASHIRDEVGPKPRRKILDKQSSSVRKHKGDGPNTDHRRADDASRTEDDHTRVESVVSLTSRRPMPKRTGDRSNGCRTQSRVGVALPRDGSGINIAEKEPDLRGHGSSNKLGLNDGNSSSCLHHRRGQSESRHKSRQNTDRSFKSKAQTGKRVGELKVSSTSKHDPAAELPSLNSSSGDGLIVLDKIRPMPSETSSPIAESSRKDRWTMGSEAPASNRCRVATVPIAAKLTLYSFSIGDNHNATIIQERVHA
jgi:hypothetical protein